MVIERSQADGHASSTKETNTVNAATRRLACSDAPMMVPKTGCTESRRARCARIWCLLRQVGDVVTMRKGLAEFWEEGERARVVKVHAIAEHKDSPYVIEMEGTGKTFQTQVVAANLSFL